MPGFVGHAFLSIGIVLLTATGFVFAQPGPSLQNSEAKPGSTTPSYSMRVEVPLVTLDATVLTQDGFFVPELKKENFRIFEDGIEQKIASLGEVTAPVTAVLLVEFSDGTFALQQNALQACYQFTKALQPNDWAALVFFDKRPTVIQDFTQDKSALQEALVSPRVPLSREINLFDALDDTLDRLRQVDGRKYIILMATGQDTFSKKILDEVYRKIESANDTIIYSVDTGLGLHQLQADNQMRVFARMTGGRFYFASSLDEYNDLYRDPAHSIRNRYTLTYRPIHHGRDGKWHKVRLQVINPDANGHNRKYQVVVREGYRAATPVK